MMLLRIAFLSLWQHRRRTLVLGAAIALVTALMLVMLGVAEGMNRSLIESSTTLMSGHVNVSGWFKVTSSQAAPVVTRAKAVREVVEREVPEARYIASRGRGFAKVVSESGSMLLGLAGVDVAQEKGLKDVLRIKEGRLEDLAQPNAVLLFEEQAAELEVRVGDALTLSVEDDGEPVGAPSGEGHGLRGMRERVALLGGRLVAGPGDARGWVVRASLPRRPA